MDPGGDVGPQQPQQNENPAAAVPDNNAPRVPRTHTSAVIINLLKSLPLISILQKNKEIEAQNAARSLKTLNHLTNPDVYPDTGSETASLITLDPEDRNRFKVSSFAASLRDHIYPSLAKWIADEEILDREVAATATSLKRKGGDEKNISSADAAAAKRRCMDGKKLVPWVVGVPWTAKFPQSLFDTEECAAVPLSFFLNKNLRLIISEASTLPTIKSNPKPGETKGISILDIDKLTAKFGSELSLSFSQWSEAANNMYLFQRERDEDGDEGAHATWYNDHFNFFNTLEKKDELYDAWKAAELKFRQEHWSTYGEFVPQRYESAYLLAEKQHEMMADMRGMVAGMSAPRGRGPAFTRDYGTTGNPKATASGSYRPRFSERPPSQPFSSGSGRPSSSTADCLVCGERGHDSRTHINSATPPKFKDGKPTWSKYINYNLVSAGGDNNTLCINWNIRGERGAPCRHQKDERAHLCSLCGSKDHHAFSWTCRPIPSL